MRARFVCLCMTCCFLGACETTRNPRSERATTPAAEPLVIGESFTIDSKVLGEVRRINVFVPTMYGEKFNDPLPVMYMPDGGLNEDFLHVAGLMQVLVSNGGMRPFVLVGIENTQRRRDLTGPTTNPEDKKMAPVVGGSAAFRQFIRNELMPEVRNRYRTTDESAIIGESLAGLFALEAFVLEPDLFSACVAVDPSLWWANEELVRSIHKHMNADRMRGKTVFIASGDHPETADLCARMTAALRASGGDGLSVQYAPLKAETHATIYHPAALLAFRTAFPPIPAAPQ